MQLKPGLMFSSVCPATVYLINNNAIALDDGIVENSILLKYTSWFR